jgi:hypothetical protein
MVAQGRWSGGERKLFVSCAGDLTRKYELGPAVKKLYQLRPKVSASRVSVASRVVNPTHDELRPAVSKELHQLHRKLGMYEMSNSWKVLTVLLYFTLYTIICTHTELLNDIDNTVVISCYCPMFKPYLKKRSFRGRRQAHYVSNIAHSKLLLWSDENTVSGKSFNILLFHVQKYFNWFPKYVW